MDVVIVAGVLNGATKMTFKSIQKYLHSVPCIIHLILQVHLVPVCLNVWRKMMN